MCCFQKAEKGKEILREEAAAPEKKRPSQGKEEERAANVREIRLPWKLCEHKDDLLAWGAELASSCHNT